MGGRYPGGNYRRGAGRYEMGDGLSGEPGRGAPRYKEPTRGPEFDLPPSEYSEQLPAPRPQNRDNYNKGTPPGIDWPQAVNSALAGLRGMKLPGQMLMEALGTPWERAYELTQPPGYMAPPTGSSWTECPPCPGTIDAQSGTVNTNCVGCLVLQAQNITSLGIGKPFPVNTNSIILWKLSAGVVGQASARYDVRRQWRRPVMLWPVGIGPRIVPYPLPQLGPETSPAPNPKLRPAVPPWLDPDSLPPLSPEPYPTHPPYWVIPKLGPNPHRPTAYQPRRGPTPDENLRPVFPRNPPVITRPRAPGPKTKERKVYGTGLAPAVRAGLNMVTESADAITAVWEAIPWKDRMAYHDGKKKPTIQARAQAIYDMWDKVDLSEAIKNLAANQAEDAAFGKAGKALGGKSRDLAERGLAPNTGRGPQSGPWDNWRPN